MYKLKINKKSKHLKRITKIKNVNNYWKLVKLLSKVNSVDYYKYSINDNINLLETRLKIASNLIINDIALLLNSSNIQIDLEKKVMIWNL